MELILMENLFIIVIQIVPFITILITVYINVQKKINAQVNTGNY